MYSKRLNKKGSADFFIWIILIFFMGVLFLIGTTIWNIVKEDVQPDITSIDGQIAIINVSRFYDNLGSIFLVSMVFLSLGLFATGFILNSHPFFLIAFIPILLVGVYISPILSNTYDSLAEDPQFKPNESPIIRYVFTHFVDVIILVGGIYAILLFGKSRNEGGITT